MKKKLLIGIILVVIIAACRFIYTMYTNSNDHSGTIYYSVNDFESQTNIKFYDLYNCEAFVAHNQKKLIRDIDSNINIYLTDDKSFYSVEVDDSSHIYTITIKPPFEENIENYEKYELENGTLYTSPKDTESNLYYGVFFKKDMKYSFTFNNQNYNFKSDKIINKFIDYIKIVEDCNQIRTKT